MVARLTNLQWDTGRRSLDLGGRPHVMGILNVTPDSFSDGGQHFNPSDAISAALRMEDDGASIIDVGGESTRPYSDPVSESEELKRVLPVIEGLSDRVQIPISIDTSKANVARAAVAAGAEIINDVTGLEGDPEMPSVVNQYGVGVCVMHMQGTPQTMQINPKYHHVLLDIYDFFEKEISNFKNDKYKRKLILDPGIGFGKKLKHNLMILNKISIFHSLGFPILIGTSRKRFINQISGKYDTKERIGGTLSSITYSLSQGVKIFRVHNVEEVKQGILVFEKLLNK